jgi:hypothetical protein
MAHSGDDRATMFASYTPGTSYKRILTADDVAGLCSIYLPDGDRVVDPSASFDGSNQVPEDTCDPTPRHGFSTQCASAPSKGCAVASAGPGDCRKPWGWLGLCAAGVVVFRRRHSKRRTPESIAVW